MAYGKNKDRKDWQYRALPLAIGRLTGAKQAELERLQSLVLELMREMAVKCFSPAPLFTVFDGKELDNALVVIQKSHASLNSAWCEQARMRVKPVLEHINNAYFKKLAGSLRFVDSRIPVRQLSAAEQRKVDAFIGPLESQEPPRLYFQVPVPIQDEITESVNYRQRYLRQDTRKAFAA